MQQRFRQNIPQVTLIWLLSGLGLTTLPHLERLPLVISAIFVSIFTLSLFIHTKKIKRPNKFVRLTLTLLIVFIVSMTHGTLIGQGASISLLIAMCAIKLTEIFSDRDIYISVLIGLFVLITHFFHSYSLLLMIYLFGCILILLSTLVSLNRSCSPKQANIRSNLKLSLSVLLQGLPIMIILFFFFPRFGSPLWGLPNNASSGTTGLSDSMEIGNIGSLIQSNAVAFRAEFDNYIPQNSKLYWRGPVLTYTDGRKWLTESSVKNKQNFINRVPFTLAEDNISYTITLEPSNNPWLFALDLPTTIPDRGRLSSTYQLITDDVINQPLRYKLNSATNYAVEQNYRTELVEALQLPADVNTQAVELGKSLREKFNSSSQITAAALDYFSTQNFTYTLQPPVLNSTHPVDQFLFQTRRGFCEHFSAAFTVILRAAGIPARVVTGYQGGDLNPLGDYFIVRQRDAHAWTEVWMDSKGWVRIDPTSVVAPDRITDGSDEIFEQSETRQPLFSYSNPLFNSIRYSLDWANNRWTQWVINYDHKRQNNFFSNLGLHNWTNAILVMVFLVTSIASLIALYVVYQNRYRLPPQLSLWYKFCHKLEQIDLPRYPHEGPKDYYHRIIIKRPELDDVIKPIIDGFIQLNYANSNDKTIENQLRQAVNQFKPKAENEKRLWFGIRSS